MASDKKRWTIAVDFDGVLHSYTSRWKGAHVIPDPPVLGAIEWLHRMLQRFDVHIFSTRGATWRGRRAMRQWLRRHGGNLYYDSPGDRGLEEVTISDRKKPALVYIDDRAMRFNGLWPLPHQIHEARPWWKEPTDG